MRGILLSILLAAMFVGIGKAQEMTGEVAEKAKQEVLKIELAKIGTLSKNGSTAADWFDRYDDPGAVVVAADGSVDNKTVHEAKLRSDVIAAISLKQYDHHVSIFDNGNLAMVVYKITGQLKGQAHPVHDTAVDLWVKKNGDWQRILHSVHRIMNLGSGGAGTD